jgi:NADH-quinone oxidoreductase subunit C
VHVTERVVEPDRWRDHCAELVAAGASMLDFLTAVDEPGHGQVEVVIHLVDVDGRARHLVRTRVDRADPQLDSLVAVLPGAAWHEREVHEMFGVVFSGSSDLRPLLTDGSAGYPLRRTSPLPARVQTPWPGAADPADRPAAHAAGGPTRAAARPRARLQPPGIPAEWARADEDGGDP